MTQPEIHTFTVETTAGISEASGRLPNPVQTFVVDTAGPALAEYRPAQEFESVPGVLVAMTAEALNASGWCPPFDDPEALREMASRLLTLANEAEASR